MHSVVARRLTHPSRSDDDDSQRDEPRYDGGFDDSDSEEIVTYDEDLEATDKRHRVRSSRSPPTQSRAASDELEAEAETRSELEAEIQHHERRPIPHATLLEENEEYGNDGETPFIETHAFELTARYETVVEVGDPEEDAVLTVPVQDSEASHHEESTTESSGDALQDRAAEVKAPPPTRPGLREVQEHLDEPLAMSSETEGVQQDRDDQVVSLLRLSSASADRDLQ